jgi:fatty-acyl-CoA synthase
VSAAGLVPVPLFPPAQASDLPTFRHQTRHLIAASRAAAVLTTTDVTPLLDNGDGTDGLPFAKVLTLNTLAEGSPLDRPVDVNPHEVALIQFTSGSTAAPKGVMLTHEGLYANVSSIAGPQGLDLSADDVGVSWLPLYHDMGLIGMLLTPVFVQADSVVMSPVLFLKRPSAWLSAISTYRATVSFAPSFAYELCLRRVKRSQIDALDLSSWRIAGCGAEPVRIETLRAFAERFGRAGFRASSFRPSYGLAEHTLAVSFSTRGLQVDTIDAGHFNGESRALPVNGTHAGPAMRIASCGRPFSDHAVRIVDEAGHTLPERQVGRIVARGPSVMAGYFEDAEATIETLHSGWLHTGDLGYIADGELYVCGRTKDLIIRNGRKYHPPDLESAIATVDGLRPSGVVVFAINRVEEPDEVVAVLEARHSSTSSDLVDHVRRRVRETSGLELDRVVVAPPGTIPRTTSGKVRRSETRERLEAGTLMASQRDAVIDGSLQ